MYKGKKIAVLGYGQEGRSATNYFLSQGANVTVFDQDQTKKDSLPPGVEFIGDTSNLSNLNEFDLVSRTPIMRPDVIAEGVNTTSSTREFFANCPAPIIAVTGTKGKGTTASLIHEILKKVGKTSHLLGNIGTPALDVLPEIKADDYVVFEISSFQLWDLTSSPHIAVVLMVAEDHMDVHSSINEYLEAKANIVKFQTEDDVVIYHPSNSMTATVVESAPGRRIRYLSDEAANLIDGQIQIEQVKICNIDEVGLLGKHNLENICAAVSAAWQITQDSQAIGQVLKSFKGLEHRLEFVRDVAGVKYYNDSYSASPSAAIVASQIFPGKSIMIFGGKDKHINYCEIAKKSKDYIKRALLIGDIAPKLADCFKAEGFDDFEILVGDINEIVKHSSQVAEAGDSVILSPGSSSFDMFENYKQRGDMFKRAVNNL